MFMKVMVRAEGIMDWWNLRLPLCSRDTIPIMNNCFMARRYPRKWSVSYGNSEPIKYRAAMGYEGCGMADQGKDSKALPPSQEEARAKRW
jgi:hypothetical protein